MHRLLLGSRGIIVWVHDLEDFESCKMVRFEADFTAQIVKNVNVWKKDFDAYKKAKKHGIETCHR